MYGIYTNIGGILMVNVTIYSIHGSYGYWKVGLPEVSRGCCFKGRDGSEMLRTIVFTVWGWMGWLLMPKEVKEIQRSSKSLRSREVFFNDVRSDCHSVSFLGVVSIKTKPVKIRSLCSTFEYGNWSVVYVSVYNCRPIIIIWVCLKIVYP